METRKIRPSAKALVVRDGKLLLVKVRDEGGVFYILPGGGQRPGELLPAAAEREVAEETGLWVKARELVFVIEGAEGEFDHRVDLLFRCELLEEDREGERIPDQNQIGAEWVPLETLEEAPLYPSKLRRPIRRFFRGEEVPVYLGNENAGDPVSIE